MHTASAHRIEEAMLSGCLALVFAVAAVVELVVHKIYGPDIIAPGRICSTLSKLRLHLPLRRFVPQLQAFLAIQPVNPFGIHFPAFSSEQHVNTPVTIAHARLCDLLDPLSQIGLRRTAGHIVIG